MHQFLVRRLVALAHTAGYRGLFGAQDCDTYDDEHRSPVRPDLHTRKRLTCAPVQQPVIAR